MAAATSDLRVSARLTALVVAAGLDPNEVLSVDLMHVPGETRVRVELCLTDAMAAALLGTTP